MSGNNGTITPSPARNSAYGVDPKYLDMRGVDLDGMTSVEIEDMLTDIPDPIYSIGGSTEKIRKATEEALSDVDMSMIEEGDTVNVLTSHHGFTILDGEPFAEFIRTLPDVIEEKTDAGKVNLRCGVGLRFREADEYIEEFNLDDSYDSAKGVAPIDAPLEVDTWIGKLDVLKEAFDADWIVHTHNSDLREIHFHRQVDRAYKPFSMSYARLEARSTYHQNLGPRAANFAARAIFDSDFVQSKYTFSAFMMTSPMGPWGVKASNDLSYIDQQVAITNMKTFGKIVTLLGNLEDVIPVLDCPNPIPYNFAGGLIYANVIGANIDLFDLEEPLPPYTFYTEVYYDEEGNAMHDKVVPTNPELKATIHNFAWGGYPSEFFAEQIPTIVVGEEQAEVFNEDPQNRHYMDHAVLSQGLEEAVDFAKNITGSENLLLFDGAQKGINVSKPLAEQMLAKASKVDKKVDQELMPKWLRQRGIDPQEAKEFQF